MTETWEEGVARRSRERKATHVPIGEDPRYAVLMETLALAVPLRIWELAARTPAQRANIAHRCAQHVAAHGDALQFGGKKGAAAAAFNALAQGLACAAYQPGGVTFAGRHWCTDHARCLRAERGEPDEPHPDLAEQVEARAIDEALPQGEWADAL